MADKAESTNKKQKQTAAKQPADKGQPIPEGVVVDESSRLGSAIDAPDPEGQSRRLADGRFFTVQRQTLAGQIGRRQGNRHLSAVLARPVTTPTGPATIQRMALPDIAGQRLGTMSFGGPRRRREPVVLAVEQELAPERQQAGQFVGFDESIHAHARAAADSNICAVVEDRQGKYHALRTGQPGRTRDYDYEIHRAPHDFRGMSFVNKPLREGELPEQGAYSWRGRVQRARAWLDALEGGDIPPEFARGCRHNTDHGGEGATLANLRSCLETEFVELLAMALDINASVVNVIRGDDDADPDAMINFNLDQDASGLGGIGHLPHDRDEAIPQPAVTIGPTAFELESHLSVVATAIHESEHGRQSINASALLQEWRSAGARRSFPEWLRRQLTRRRNPITQEQHDVALEMWQRGSEGGASRHPDDQPTEVQAYIEGFIRTYPNRPVTGTAYRFRSISTGARFWTACSSETVKQQAIQSLSNMYAAMDEAHQRDFRGRAQSAARSAPANKRPFWQAVVAQVLT